MKIIITGIEPQFKIYKMSENIENKFYIGKTKQPLKDRMNSHINGSHDCIRADKHFADVGWRNITVEIIDTANSSRGYLGELQHPPKLSKNSHLQTPQQPTCLPTPETGYLRCRGLCRLAFTTCDRLFELQGVRWTCLLPPRTSLSNCILNKIILESGRTMT